MKYVNLYLKRLVKNQRGVVAITFAVSLGTILTGSLISLDYVRHNTAQTRIQNALDTAVISAGRRLSQFIPTDGDKETSQKTRWENDAYGYFKANMPDGFLGTIIERDDVKIKYLEDREGTDGRFLAAQRVQMTATGRLPLLSTGHTEATSLGLLASNEIVRRTRNDLEVVLALDNTGSMNYNISNNNTASSNNSRMYYLKQAARTLIDTIEEATAYSSENPDGGATGAYIGLVPFTDNVRVGHLPNAKKWIEYPSLLENYINNIWSSSTGSSGCIVEQDPPSGSNWNSSNRVPTTPLNPANKPFKPMVGVNAEEFGLDLVSGEYMVFDDRYPLMGYSVASTNSSRDRLITMRTNNNNAWPNKNPSASNSPTGLILNLAREPEYCTKSKTYFLTKELKNIQTAITNMEAYGGTGVSTGLLWAWRMLSPDWRGSNGWGDPDLPRDPDPKLRKVIVLLSDGDNAPVVARPISGLNSSTSDSYNVNFKYSKCSKYSGKGSSKKCHKDATRSTVTKTLKVDGSTSSFAQCPVNGLRSAVMTANSFNTSTSAQNLTKSKAACEVKSSGYNADTALGFTHHPTGKDSFSGGAMTAQSFDNHLIKVCDNIAADKENKITIYSLTLGAGVQNQQSRVIMQNCAVNTGGKYFDAQSSAALSDAFAQIAGALTELRLTK